MADGFRQDSQAPTSRAAGAQHSAAVVLVVKALVDAGMRRKQPERKFAGYTDVEQLAAAAVGLFSQPAADLNGQRMLLAPVPASPATAQSAANTQGTPTT